MGIGIICLCKWGFYNSCFIIFTNNNGNCDDDEGSRSCADDCGQSGCMENNQFQPYDCVKMEDGCLHRKVLDIQINRCNVECLDNNGCRLGQKCVNYKCEDKICGDGQCDDTENCNCEDCKKELKEIEICCDGKTIEGDCCSNEYCKNENSTCVKNKCIPYCGDGNCDITENCFTCKLDCILEENKICCGGIIKEGSCEEQLPTNETNGSEIS